MKNLSSQTKNLHFFILSIRSFYRFFLIQTHLYTQPKIIKINEASTYKTTNDHSSKVKKQVDPVIQSIQKSQQHEFQPYSEILELPGISNPRVRHLLHNLWKRIGALYLEIGCWKSRTFITSQETCL